MFLQCLGLVQEGSWIQLGECCRRQKETKGGFKSFQLVSVSGVLNGGGDILNFDRCNAG